MNIQGIHHIAILTDKYERSKIFYTEVKGLRQLAFAVVNLDKAVSELKSHLVEIEPIRTDEITGKKFCFFHDPNGQPLELYEI